MKHREERSPLVHLRSRVARAALAALAALAVAGCGDDQETNGLAETSVACLAERLKAINPIDKVSEGEVLVVSEEDGVKTLYIDATAGGSMAQAENPWIYVSLASATRVDLKDAEADADLSWDLAMKRPVIRTNSGDGSAGKGGAVFLKEKTFEQAMEEAGGASLSVESWFAEGCVLKKDAGGYIATTFDGWYDYGGEATHAVSPHPGVFVVRGGQGALYAVELLSYYANPDGTDGMVSGRFLLRYAPVSP